MLLATPQPQKYWSMVQDGVEHVYTVCETTLSYLETAPNSSELKTLPFSQISWWRFWRWWIIFSHRLSWPETVAPLGSSSPFGSWGTPILCPKLSWVVSQICFIPWPNKKPFAVATIGTEWKCGELKPRLRLRRKSIKSLVTNEF